MNQTAQSDRIIPLVMCGGAGTRLWPSSREGRPKQFLALLGARSTFQETMLRAWRSLDDVPADHESQRRWLFTVARRNAIDAARARQVRPREVAADDMTQIPAEDKAIDEVVAAHTVRRVLHRLTDDHLTVVIGLYYRGLSTTEMARQLGVPEGTVKSRTHYALRTLRGAIGRIDRV